jgi:hypothetical protein
MAFRLRPENMPPPQAAIGTQGRLMPIRTTEGA